VWGALDVLDVGLGLDLDSAVRELLVGDGLSAVEHLAGALPVPIEATGILEASHLLVSQRGDNLEHLTAIAVHAEHVVLNELGLVDALHEVAFAAWLRKASVSVICRELITE